MIYFGDKVKEKLAKIKGGNFYVLSDYDQTITNGMSSWELPPHLKSSAPKFKKECEEVGTKFLGWLREYNKTNDPILRDKIVSWWYEEMGLFVKYKVSLSEMKETILNDGLVSVRSGTREFFEKLNKSNIPVVILSAGFVEVIETTLLRENCNFNNIEVFANRLEVDGDNRLLGVRGEMIHWLNKSENNLMAPTLEKIKNIPNVFLFGDQKSDIDMLPEHKRDGAIKIGFKSSRVIMPTETYLQYFDIACDDSSSFIELMNELKSKYGFDFG
ncbi:MAG: HAD-IB family phosphatase [Christensenellaceae bacterium]|jgi:HAD superfamily hydrolase (TIGR01544 family)|nr:HAD-IB family phosphatase [Christensenellaceae bacterium]